MHRCNDGDRLQRGLLVGGRLHEPRQVGRRIGPVDEFVEMQLDRPRHHDVAEGLLHGPEERSEFGQRTRRSIRKAIRERSERLKQARAKRVKLAESGDRRPVLGLDAQGVASARGGAR